MNSMAVMKSNPPKPTLQSKALKSAIDRSGMTQEAIAEHMGNVTPALIGQWARGVRPVPATRARRLAELLGIPDPRRISLAFAEVAQGEGSVVALRKHQGSEGAQAERERVLDSLPGDVDLIHTVLAAVAATMIRHRPAEARDVAHAIRRMVPAHQQDSIFLTRLLEALDRAK